MLKRTLLTILTCAGICLYLTFFWFSCNDKEDKRGHNPLSKAHYYEEKAVMFTIDYYKKHGSWPSYYTRWLYYEHKDDKYFIDSLINKNPIKSFRGEGYTEGTIPISVFGIPCPHIIMDSIVTTGSKVFLPSKWVEVEYSKIGNQVFKWTGASKAKRGNEMYFEGCTGKGSKIVTDKYGKPIRIDSSGRLKGKYEAIGGIPGNHTYLLAVDSLGNIIEDTVCVHNLIEPTFNSLPPKRWCSKCGSLVGLYDLPINIKLGGTLIYDTIIEDTCWFHNDNDNRIYRPDSLP